MKKLTRGLATLILVALVSSFVSAKLKTEPESPEFQRKFFDSILELGGVRYIRELETSGYDFVELYPTLHARLSFKTKPQLLGFFILQVHEIGKYFRYYVGYYGSLDQLRRGKLRKAMLAEEALDKYCWNTAENLMGVTNNEGPIHRALMSYLGEIENFIGQLRAEESKALSQSIDPRQQLYGWISIGVSADPTDMTKWKFFQRANFATDSYPLRFESDSALSTGRTLVAKPLTGDIQRLLPIELSHLVVEGPVRCKERALRLNLERKIITSDDCAIVRNNLTCQVELHLEQLSRSRAPFVFEEPHVEEL